MLSYVSNDLNYLKSNWSELPEVNLKLSMIFSKIFYDSALSGLSTSKNNFPNKFLIVLQKINE